MSRNNYALIAAGCFVAAGILILGISLPFANGSETALAVSVSLLVGAVMIVAIAMRLARNGGNLFDSLILFSFVLFFYFVVHLVWLVVSPSWSDATIFHPFRDELSRSQALFGFSYIILLVGYALPFERAVRRGRPPAAYNLKETSSLLLAFLFLLGMASNAIAASNGGYSKATAAAYKATGNILVFRTVGYIAFVAFLIGLAKVMHMEKDEGRGTKVFVYGVMLPVQIVWAFAVSAKMEALFILFGFAVARNYWRRFIGFRTMLVGLALFVFVVTPLVQATRAEYGRGEATNLQDIRRTLTVLPNRLKIFARPTSWSDGVGIIQQRTNGSESLALAVKYTPELRDYQHGASWKAIPLSLIPRFLWPSKPLITTGKDFSIVYGGQYTGKGFGQTLGPTIPGDLWVNFGAPGLLAGFFVLGLFLRFLQSLVSPRSRWGEAGVIAFVTLMIPFMLVEQDVATAVATALLRSLVVFGVVFLVTRVRFAAAARAVQDTPGSFVRRSPA